MGEPKKTVDISKTPFSRTLNELERVKDEPRLLIIITHRLTFDPNFDRDGKFVGVRD